MNMAAKRAKAEWKWLKVIYGKLDKIDNEIKEIKKRLDEFEEKIKEK